MSIFCPLYSGSSGNSLYLKSGSTSLLIDLGVSCKAAVTALTQLDVVPSDLDGILITHEHSDHMKGLSVFLKKTDVPVYASAAVLEYIENNIPIPAHSRLIPITTQEFSIGDVSILPFSTPHDSVGSLGYRIRTAEGKYLGIATDLGEFTDEVSKGLEGCNIVLLESNYDEAMMMVSAYPYYLKRRIMSQSGHLSNMDCAQAAVKLVQKGTEHFVLGHLSINSNMQPLAYQTTQVALCEQGLLEGNDFTLQIAKRKEISIPINF